MPKDEQLITRNNVADRERVGEEDAPYTKGLEVSTWESAWQVVSRHESEKERRDQSIKD